MLTSTDIELLKKTFVTKDEWQEQNQVIAREFKGLVQLMGEMEERLINRMDSKFAKQDERFEKLEQWFKENDKMFDTYQTKIDQRFKESDDKFYSLLNKMTEQYSVLLNQEKRVSNVEQNIPSAK